MQKWMGTSIDQFDKLGNFHPQYNHYYKEGHQQWFITVISYDF
jgi:hypothetical protein